MEYEEIGIIGISRSVPERGLHNGRASPLSERFEKLASTK